MENHSRVLAEVFVAQAWPKENSSKICRFKFDGFRNFYDFSDFGGISTLHQTLWGVPRCQELVSKLIVPLSQLLLGYESKVRSQTGTKVSLGKPRKLLEFTRNRRWVRIFYQNQLSLATSGASRWLEGCSKSMSGASSESGTL